MDSIDKDLIKSGASDRASVFAETPRLRLRRLDRGDEARVATYRNNPEASRYQGWSQYTEKMAEALIREMNESEPAALGKWFQFGIELRAEHRLVGDIGFLNTDSVGRCWIGYTLDPAYWGQGYAREAVAAAMDYYRKLGVTAVWASTDPLNQRSARLLFGLGFKTHEKSETDWIFRIDL